MLLLCLFKNIGVKLVSRTDEGDGEGEGERQTEDLSSWFVLLSLQFMQISCRCLSYPSNGRLNLFHWNIICTESTSVGGENIKSVNLVPVGWCTLFCIGTFSLACFCSSLSLQEKNKGYFLLR